MKKLTKTLVFALFATAVLAEDIIIFNNGDTLSGKILNSNDTRVYLKTKAFGSVSVPRESIKEIHRDENYAPLVSTTPPAPKLEKTEPVIQQPTPQPTTKVSQKKRIPIFSLFRKSDTDGSKEKVEGKERGKWSGNAGLSITFRESGNLDSDTGDKIDELDWEYYYLHGKLKWAKGKNSLEWSGAYRYTQKNEDVYDDYFNITQKYKRDLTKSYFASSKALYQRDYRRNIEDEQLLTAELGIKWLDTPKLKLSTSGGGAYHHYLRSDRASAGQTEPPSFSGGKFIFDQSFRWQANGTLALFEKFTHLGNFASYHMFFKGGIENKLVQDLFLQVAYSFERETEFSYRDKAYYDTRLLTSIHYKF